MGPGIHPAGGGENDLERARIEYKREVGNGTKVLDAIAALANTFGGTVLVGVDEDQPLGPGRLTGVPGAERDRLSRMCWDRLAPPFGPEIIPVPLAQADRYVLVVVADPQTPSARWRSLRVTSSWSASRVTMSPPTGTGCGSCSPRPRPQVPRVAGPAAPSCSTSLPT